MENNSNKREAREKTMTEQIDETLDVIINNFDRHLSNIDDPLIVFLKGHLLIEYYMNQLIILYDVVSNPHEINKLSFAQKISEIEKHDNLARQNKNGKVVFKKETTLNVLRIINKVRNNLAHELEYTMKESDIDSIGFCLGKDYIYDKYKLRLNEGVNEKKISGLLKITLLRFLPQLFSPVVREIVFNQINQSSAIKNADD